MTEIEANAWATGGMNSLAVLWDAGDELEPMLDAATARAEAAEQRAEAAEREVARARADGFGAGINAAANALACRAEAFAGFGHYDYARAMREARQALQLMLAEAQPAEVSDG